MSYACTIHVSEGTVVHLELLNVFVNLAGDRARYSTDGDIIIYNIFYHRGRP